MNIEIANRLVQLRKDKGLSQEDLADKLGISRQSVSKWERAESSPDTDNLICLAQIYGVSLDELLHSDQNVDEIAKEEKEKTEETTANKKNVSIQIDGEKVVINKGGKKYEKNVCLTDEEKAFCENTLHLKGKRIFNKFFTTLIWLAAIVGYVTAASITGMWHPLWLVFFAVICIDSLVDAVLERDFSAGAFYPVLVSGIYLLLGFLFNLWHPYWFLFVTIPVYYALVELLNFLFKCGKWDPNHKIRKKYLNNSFEKLIKENDDEDDD